MTYSLIGSFPDRDSGESQAMPPQRERSDSATGGGEDRVGERGNYRYRPHFADSAERPSAAVDEINIHRRHFGHSQHLVVMPVALNGTALFKGDLGLIGTGEAPGRTTLDRICGDPAVQNRSAVNDGDNPMYLDASVRADGKLHHVSDHGQEGFAEGDAPVAPKLWRSLPAGFFRREVEHGERPWAFR